MNKITDKILKPIVQACSHGIRYSTVNKYINRKNIQWHYVYSNVDEEHIADITRRLQIHLKTNQLGVYAFYQPCNKFPNTWLIIILDRQTKKNIPYGEYCYEPISVDENGKMKIKKCPYHVIDETQMEHNNGYCKYLNSGDWMEDGTLDLWDMVKNCNVNMGEE